MKEFIRSDFYVGNNGEQWGPRAQGRQEVKGRSQDSDKANKQMRTWEVVVGNDKLLVSLLGVSLGSIYHQSSGELSPSPNTDQQRLGIYM